MVTQLPTRRLGDLQVTVVGIGCDNFGRRLDAAGTRAVFDAAHAHGINFFDTADIYGGAGASERLLDLYQYHEPDGVTPIEETLRALDELVHAGLVRGRISAS